MHMKISIINYHNNFIAFFRKEAQIIFSHELHSQRQQNVAWDLSFKTQRILANNKREALYIYNIDTQQPNSEIQEIDLKFW